MTENSANPPAEQHQVNEEQRSHKMVVTELEHGQKAAQEAAAGLPPSGPPLLPPPVAPVQPEAAEPAEE